MAPVGSITSDCIELLDEIFVVFDEKAMLND